MKQQGQGMVEYAAIVLFIFIALSGLLMIAKLLLVK
jgi:hypothetical protein